MFETHVAQCRALRQARYGRSEDEDPAIAARNIVWGGMAGVAALGTLGLAWIAHDHGIGETPVMTVDDNHVDPPEHNAHWWSRFVGDEEAGTGDEGIGEGGGGEDEDIGGKPTDEGGEELGKHDRPGADAQDKSTDEGGDEGGGDDRPGADAQDVDVKNLNDKYDIIERDFGPATHSTDLKSNVFHVLTGGKYGGDDSAMQKMVMGEDGEPEFSKHNMEIALKYLRDEDSEMYEIASKRLENMPTAGVSWMTKMTHGDPWYIPSK